MSSVQPKEKKKSHETNPIFYLIIFHIELSRHKDQSLLAREKSVLEETKKELKISILSWGSQENTAV